MKDGFGKFAKSFDLFSVQIPSFNMGGETHVRTWTGAFVSLLIMALTLVFAFIKLDHLASRKNPIITSNEEPLQKDEVYAMGSEDFMFAFAAEHWLEGRKDDPSFI